MSSYDLIIIGGGAAGMLCAIEGKKKGIENILVIEKNPSLGGALTLGNYNISTTKNITGKEYLKDLLDKYSKLNIDTYFNTMVININNDGKVVCLSPDRGMEELSGKNIILTNGAKEKGKNALDVPGDRCAGVMTLLNAKNILNLEGVVPGKDIIIYGTENLHMIMKDLEAHDLNIKGIVCERPRSESTKITNNIYEKSHITSISGVDRVKSIKISNGVNEKEITCDTVILALGMLSDGLVAFRSNITLNPETTGPKVDNNFETSRKNIFACGNGIYIHDSIEEIEDEANKLIQYIITG